MRGNFLCQNLIFLLRPQGTVATEMKTSAKRQKVNALNKSLIKHDEGINNKEYLDAFDPDESAGGVNADQEERQFEDVPLYDGAPISMAVSMLLIVTYAVRHSLTGLALVDLLTLISLHCALPNQCASSVALLKKFFMKLKNPIQFHYYCTFCMEYQGLSIPEDKLCKNRCCFEGSTQEGEFFILPYNYYSTYVPLVSIIQCNSCLLFNTQLFLYFTRTNKYL